MTKKGIELPSKTMPLTVDPTRVNYPGFVKVESARKEQGQFAKVFASAFLKFSHRGIELLGKDSVQNFIHLAELHQELTLEVQAFLRDEVPFIYEGQPIQQLLLDFASYRLKQAHDRQRYASLQGAGPEITNELRELVRVRQETYDRILECQ